MQETPLIPSNIVNLFTEKTDISIEDSLAFASDYLTCATAISARLVSYYKPESQAKAQLLVQQLKEAHVLLNLAIAGLPSTGKTK